MDRSLGNGAGLSPGVSLCQNKCNDPPILFCYFTVHACGWPCDAVMKKSVFSAGRVLLSRVVGRDASAIAHTAGIIFAARDVGVDI